MHDTLGRRAMAGQPPTDAELIGRCRAGDRGAFGERYVRYAKLARNRARRLTGSPSEAEDVVADAFARIFATFRRAQLHRHDSTSRHVCRSNGEPREPGSDRAPPHGV
jgi:hypothetical protein